MASTGPCDQPEICDGLNLRACPAGQFQGASTGALPQRRRQIAMSRSSVHGLRCAACPPDGFSGQRDALFRRCRLHPRRYTCQAGLCLSGVPTPPDEVTQLEALSKSVFAWDAVPGNDPTVAYDVPRGLLPVGLPVGVGQDSCIGQSLPSTAASDGGIPTPGTAFWYLVRAVNACSAGSYGDTSVEAPRVTEVCDP